MKYIPYLGKTSEPSPISLDYGTSMAIALKNKVDLYDMEDKIAKLRKSRNPILQTMNCRSLPDFDLVLWQKIVFVIQAELMGPRAPIYPQRLRKIQFYREYKAKGAKMCTV